MVTCRHCDEEIYFDDDHISESGKKIPLGEDYEPHQCEEGRIAWQRENPLECQYCGVEIYFAPFNGKRIPFEVANDGPHRCEEGFAAWRKAHPIKCQHCDKPIFFNDKNMSVSGKHIPMDVDTGDNHNCPKNPYNRRFKRYG